MSDEKLLQLARSRFKFAEEADVKIREEENEDKRFRAGEQWPDEVKVQRNLDKRPCLTINRLPQFVQQITNEHRQNRPSIKVSPVSDGADEDTAKIYQGLIRHIENKSGADAAYDQAFEDAVDSGRGYFRIITDYCDPSSFDQDILIKRIPNKSAVYLDPTFKEADASDIGFAFILDDLTEDEYKEQYPNSKLASLDDWGSLGNRTPGWISKGHVRIAEYYYKENRSCTLLLLNDGSALIKEDLSKEELQKIENNKMLITQRKTEIPQVKWVKINAVEVLERTDIPGMFIPILAMFGNELHIDGQRRFEGIIRHAKDPQRMYNYWASSQTETIALAPKAPYVGAAGQFKGYEKQWREANVKNLPYLEYNPVTSSGQPVSPPQRQFAEPNVQAITQARMASAEDLKATTGIYDPTLGNRQADQSGIAIQRLNNQSQTSNYHFLDNRNRALRHAGRIIVSWIPHVYDTPRVVRIIQEDDEEMLVKINQEFQEGNQAKSYDMDKGTYEVDVDTGPTYATRRQETVASMLDLIKSYPPAAQATGDLLVKAMDWPGKDEIAERLKKLLPPGLADDPKKQQPLPPQAQAMMQHMNQMIQQLTQELHAQTEIVNTKKLDLESKERIALINAQTQLQIALMKADSAEALEGFKQEVGMIHKRLELLKLDQSLDQEINPTGGAAPGDPAAASVAPPSTGGVSPGQPMGG